MKSLSKAKKAILTFSLFFSGHILAAQVRQSYCFQPHTSPRKVASQVQGFLLPQDTVQIQENSNCIVVSIDSKRHDLIDKFIRQRYKLGYSNTNSLDLRTSATAKERCNVTVESTGHSKSGNRSANAGRSRLHAKDQVTSGRNNSISTLVLSSGHTGSITMDGESIRLTCVKTNLGFVITLNLNASKGGLSTSLNVSPGKKTEIGSIVQSLKTKNQNVSLGSGIQYNKDKLKSSAQYYLTVR